MGCGKADVRTAVATGVRGAGVDGLSGACLLSVLGSRRSGDIDPTLFAPFE